MELMEYGPVMMESLRAADTVINEVSRKLRLVSSIHPVNEQSERALFFEGKIREPKFLYKKAPPVCLEALKRLRIPDCYWGNLLQTQRRRLLRLQVILESSKDLDVRDLSREIYGSPSEALQSAARQILSSVKEKKESPVSWETTKEVLESSLRAYGLNDWSVKASPGDFTAARSVERTIYLTPVGALYEGTAARLAVHEVGVHALRAVNGLNQKLSLFATGLPDYENTEEGLATYVELHTGTITAAALRNYAARVLAVASMERGRSFGQCFQDLREHGIQAVAAWETSVRAYRGGGLFKDHIYLQGLLDVFKHMTSDGKWDELYLGKVGLQHLQELRLGLASGLIQPAPILPGFVNEQAQKGELWNMVEKLAR